ncbi:MAG TPA: helix-turn-helix domain-containing protein [Jatrophihabitans sp.]|jgi:DNA-binding transcriptional MerR regulator|nr:helix-turn-helix domain-containing protein [Jatrophihabitans sp.]
MFSIGEFAKHGRVSVRMLRHYDAIGLLPPARVDPFTGYRSYRADQLSQLNRIIALRDLGFGLDQIAELLTEQLDLPQLWGMLRLRQAELRTALAAGTAQLGGSRRGSESSKARDGCQKTRSSSSHCQHSGSPS